jgi:hypothetical protein
MEEEGIGVAEVNHCRTMKVIEEHFWNMQGFGNRADAFFK